MSKAREPAAMAESSTESIDTRHAALDGYDTLALVQALASDQQQAVQAALLSHRCRA